MSVKKIVDNGSGQVTGITKEGVEVSLNHPVRKTFALQIIATNGSAADSYFAQPTSEEESEYSAVFYDGPLPAGQQIHGFGFLLRQGIETSGSPEILETFTLETDPDPEEPEPGFSKLLAGLLLLVSLLLLKPLWDGCCDPGRRSGA